MFQVSNVIQDLSRKVSPGNITDSRDIFGVLSEGARKMLLKISPYELTRRTPIENAIYSDVFKYAAPIDMNEKKVVQWYKLNYPGTSGNVTPDTFFHPIRQVTNRQFEQLKGSGFGYNQGYNVFTTEWQSGVRFIKVSDFYRNDTKSLGETIHKMDSLTEDGTWNVFGNAVNLTLDDLNYVAGSGSLRFDMNTSAASGGIENFTMTPKDISEYFNVGKVFMWMTVPNLNQIQTITLRLGSSLTDYYEVTSNSPHDTTQFQLGQNLVGFALDKRTINQTGTPNPAAITYVRIEFTTNSTLLLEDVRLDNIIAKKGSVFGIQYVSEYLFHDASTGLWKERPTDTSDFIHVESDTYEVYLSECAVILGQEIFSGTRGDADLKKLESERKMAYKEYKQAHKEEFIDVQQQFYQYGVPFGYYDNDGGSGRSLGFSPDPY